MTDTTIRTIEGRTVTAKVGSIIRLDSGRCEPLMASDWDAAQFRFPNQVAEWREKHAIACNVTITGRTFQDHGNGYQVRVELTWVGDGEPDTKSGGWLLVNPWDCPKVSEAA